MKTILSYLFYYLGDLICKIMHLFRAWFLYSIYNYLIGKSGEYNVSKKAIIKIRTFCGNQIYNPKRGMLCLKRSSIDDKYYIPCGYKNLRNARKCKDYVPISQIHDYI